MCFSAIQNKKRKKKKEKITLKQMNKLTQSWVSQCNIFNYFGST